MRIKTVPRHRILQRNMEVAFAQKICPNEEKIAEKTIVAKKVSIYTINDQNSYQAYESPSATRTAVTTNVTSNNGLNLSSSASVLSLLTSKDKTNMRLKSDTIFQKGPIYTGEKQEQDNTEVINLSIKDALNRADEIASGTSAESENKLKGTFLYKIMTDPNFLENIQKNKQPKKFICLFCKENFTTCEELTSHIDVKKNDSNQIVCCACKKTFAEKRYLKYHRRCHSERTKFTCDICTKKYTRLDNLTRHNVLHVNPDKFSCMFCNRTFTRKDLLNKHQKSHEKYNLYCECGKYFKKNFTLENHQKMHHKISSASLTTTENLTSTENMDRKAENLLSVENIPCKTENLISTKSNTRN